VKVFLDTNVLVSALTTRGLCADLVELLIEENCEVLLGAPVVVELRRILAEKFNANLENLAFAPEFLARLTPVADSPTTLPTRVSIPDPDDVPVVACALAAHANVFITGDKALLDLKKVRGMAILSPRGFWERLRQGD
jgi:uncharacterized protein